MNTKFIKILLLLVTVGYAAQAQLPEVGGVEDKYRFGFKIYPNFSTLKTMNSATTDFYETEKAGGLTGFGFGAIFDYKFGRNYYFNSGFNIVTGGGKLNITSTNDNDRGGLNLKSGDVAYRMQYIEVPFGVKMVNPIGDNIGVFANIGAQLGINIGKKAKYDNIRIYEDPSNVSSSSDFEKITGTSMTPFMFGMNLGAGLTYNINDNLDGLFSVSFTNYFTPDITNPNKGMLYSKVGAREIVFDDGKQRMNGIQLNFGLLF